jgi:hypothetical protein
MPTLKRRKTEDGMADWEEKLVKRIKALRVIVHATFFVFLHLSSSTLHLIELHLMVTIHKITVHTSHQ